MSSLIHTLREKILSGEDILFNEAMALYETEASSLYQAADEIRAHFCGERVDLCAILNARSGGCEEDCAYCAQSRHHFTSVAEYPLVSVDQVLTHAKRVEEAGVGRFSLVTSGRALHGEEFDRILEIYEALRRHTSLSLCASLGCLSESQLVALREVGVVMYHHNLETGPRFFPRICSTHTFEDRKRTIIAAQKAGLTVCSGGIIGMGESREDRIEMALSLRSLQVTSIPINILVPIEGTPLQGFPPLPDEEVYRTIAIYRFLLPRAFLRFAGGRIRLTDGGRQGYRAGINAALVGNLLTTVGNPIDEDKKIIQEMGLEIAV